MKKFFRIFILINITCTLLLGTIFLDYKKAQAAPVIPYAIWGVSEAVLALFGAFGLEVGIKNAYSDHKVLDQDALNILQDFRGFLANGAGLMSLPYNAIETQLNTLERMLADAQVKGYLELIRGNILEKLTVTPNGPIKNKHEKSLIDSIKAYVVTRQVIEKSLKPNNIELPSDGLIYDKYFYKNKFDKWIIDNHGYSLSDYSIDNLYEYLDTITPSKYYFWATQKITSNGRDYNVFYTADSEFLNNDTLISAKVAMNKFQINYFDDGYFSNRYCALNNGFPIQEILNFDNLTISSNLPAYIKYLKNGDKVDTVGNITVNPDVSKLIDRDGNLDNFEIVTPGTIIQPDGGLDGNIIIPVPKTFPENEPLPAGQTKPNLEYGTQIDYGTGTNLNGQTNIVDLPVPDPVPSTDWTADEISTNEKSKSLVTIFPFCIPFDLIAAFKLLLAKPVCPHWEFDWTIPSLNFSHHFVIDLAIFNILFLILNKMLLLSFIVALILLTRTIIRG